MLNKCFSIEKEPLEWDKQERVNVKPMRKFLRLKKEEEMHARFEHPCHVQTIHCVFNWKPFFLCGRESMDLVIENHNLDSSNQHSIPKIGFDSYMAATVVSAH